MKTNKSRHNVHIRSYRNKRLEDLPTLYEAMEFFLDELFKRCTLDYTLNIKVDLRNGSLIAEDGSHNDGLAHQTTIKGETWYHIELSNDAPFLGLLSTLAHETIHVYQFATGRLKTDDDNWVWDGNEYGSNPYIGKEIDNQLPWEYDAYSKEIDLTKKFVKKYYSNW